MQSPQLLQHTQGNCVRHKIPMEDTQFLTQTLSDAIGKSLQTLYIHVVNEKRPICLLSFTIPPKNHTYFCYLAVVHACTFV